MREDVQFWLMFGLLVTAIFLGGMAVGRGMGKVQSEVSAKEGGR